MKNAALTAMLAIGTLVPSARAQNVQLIGSDPLSRQIIATTSQQNGGVTAAVRSGTGQVVVLHLADVTSSFSASLAPAASSTDAGLKTAVELKPKAVKRGKAGRSPRRAVDQLKRVHAHKSW
jgi:hypothetical protein